MLTEEDWQEITELVYLDGGSIVEDSRLKQRVPNVNVKLLFLVIEDNIIEEEVYGDIGKEWEQIIDWDSVIRDYTLGRQ